MFENETEPNSEAINNSDVVETKIDDSINSSENASGEKSAEDSDNIKLLREHAKSLKSDLEKYKSVYEFFETTFGREDIAKQAHEIYSGYTAEEFNPDIFIKYLETLSPKRAEMLVEKLSSQKALQLVDDKIEEIFGSKPSTEEIRLFKEWKNSGYGLDSLDDIPDELKYNSDGTRKDEREIQYLRDLKNQLKSLQESVEMRKREEEYLKQQQYEEQINLAIAEFADNRINIIHKELDKLGLVISEADTVQDRLKKEAIRRFIVNGVTGEFMNNPDALQQYNTAISHIKNGEPVLAKRYEARIEKYLLDILRSDSVGIFLSNFAKEEEPTIPRPDISKSVKGTDYSEKPAKNRSASEIYSKLVEQGAITP